ncbi:hypothetical protein ACQ4PT_001432 [Festuca glaucescens]
MTATPPPRKLSPPAARTRPVAKTPPRRLPHPYPPPRHHPHPSPPTPQRNHLHGQQHKQQQQQQAASAPSAWSVGFLTSWLSHRTSVLGLRGWVLVAAGAAALALALLALTVCLCRCRRRRRRCPRVAPSLHHGAPSRSMKHHVHQAMAADKDVVVEEPPVRWHPPPPPFQPPIEVIKAEQEAPLIAAGSARTTSPGTATSSGGWSSGSGASDAGPEEAARGGWGRRYTRREMEEATDGLAAHNVLGEGGYGVVYRGLLRDSTAVAIKSLHNNSSRVATTASNCFQSGFPGPKMMFKFHHFRGQAEKDFRVEVATIGRVRHKNLVSLLGYCSEGPCRMLVYEYMENSNLEKWLHHDDGGEVSQLSWDTRMHILLGTAKGYVAPEYARTGMLNERSDVYSFGVLVMEMITGRTPVDYTRPTAEVNLVEWLKRMVAERRVEEVVDPKLPEAPPSKVLKRAVLAGLRCVDPDGGQRPTMGHVVHMLEDDLRFRDELQLARDLSPHASSSWEESYAYERDEH